MESAEWNADGTRMERRWNANGTPMERRWNLRLSGSSIALNGTSIAAFFTEQSSHELPPNIRILFDPHPALSEVSPDPIRLIRAASGLVGPHIF